MIQILHKRNIVSQIIPFLKSKEAIIIYGARQVGKTSLLRYLIQEYLKENVFYLDLEIPSLLELCNKSSEDVYTYLLQKGALKEKTIFLIIDEIQYLENPSQFIKIMHDHYPEIKIFASGSSAFEIRKKLNQSLTGRAIIFDLYPLSFDEFLMFKGKKYDLQEKNADLINQELIPLAEEYIRFGGYPQIVLEPSEEKKFIYLSQIITTYIRKDIRNIGKIRNITSFNKLVEILASQTGQLMNTAELSRTLGITQRTIIEYLEILELTFIIKIMRPFHKNLRSELSKTAKVFFLDTGMLHLLWMKEFPKTILGNVFETFVFLEFMKNENILFFWRTTNKQEIDFIIRKKNNLYAIESKLQFQKESSALRFFAEHYPCQTFMVGLYGEKKGKYPWEMIKVLEDKKEEANNK